MMTRYPATFYFALAFIAGCATPPAKNQRYLEQSAQAELLMQGGRHKEAADLYKNLAQVHPALQNNYYLLTAEALLQSGDHQQASAFADKVNTHALSFKQHNRLELIRARIDLSMGNAESAQQHLNNIQPVRLDSQQRKQFYRTQAFAYSLTGDPLASTQARIKLGDLLTQPELIQQNNASILETLRLLPAAELFQAQAPAPDILGGWAALAYLIKQHTSLHAFNAALAEWQLRHPNHPANNAVLLAYLQPVQHSFEQPNAIALLLPESGPFAGAAAALRQGFMAAYHQDARQPALRFYDSHSIEPIALYEQAVSEGAELVIGPLHKDKILALVNAIDLPVPVLALNSIENLSKPNLFQFALSPLDETRELSAKARLDGHHKALFLLPNNAKGQRIAGYLQESWQDAEGHVLETQLYDSGTHDFTQPIQRLLNLDESKSRFKRLRNLVNRSLQFTPRRRQDVDAIFISAPPKTARSLNPQLMFFHANDVPVYAMPNIYNGSSIPSLDSDLNNISFCDLPWMFDEVYEGYFSKSNLSAIWQQRPRRYLRLIAMGVDAFNLVNHLGTLNQEKYPGTTGLLSLNLENRIQRELACARFENGYVVSSGYIQATPPSIENDTYDDDAYFDDRELEEAIKPIFHEIR